MKLTTLSFLLATALLQLHGADTTPNPPKAAPQAPATPAAAFKNVGPEEFEKLRRDKKNVVLDVRTAKEYAIGHIPGAVNFDVNGPDFEKKVAALDTNKTYLVHCAAGVRSAKACDRLSKLSFSHLVNLHGGMKAWEKSGYKAEQ